MAPPSACSPIADWAAQGAWPCTPCSCPSPSAAGLDRSPPRVKGTGRAKGKVREKYLWEQNWLMFHGILFSVWGILLKAGWGWAEASFPRAAFCSSCLLDLPLAGFRLACWFFFWFLLACRALGEPWRAASLSSALIAAALYFLANSFLCCCDGFSHFEFLSKVFKAAMAPSTTSLEGNEFVSTKPGQQEVLLMLKVINTQLTAA